MTVVEKAAYLKGLVDGIGFEPDSDEEKLWNAVGDVLLDIAHEIEDLQAANEDHAEALDDISQELSYIEETVYDLDDPSDFEDYDEYDDDDEPCSGSCGSCCNACGSTDDELDTDEDELTDELDEGDDLGEYDGVIYNVVCPVCGEEINFDEDTLNEGSIKCPSCNETLEFDFSEE